MINKMNNDNLLNVLVNIKMATYMYKTQNNLNLNHNKKTTHFIQWSIH